MGYVEALAIIVLFLVITHLLAKICLRKGETQHNFYEKTEKEVELLNLDNRNTKNRSIEGNGPDYIQL